MAIQGTMVLDMTDFSQRKTGICILKSGVSNQAREMMDQHLGNSQYDAEVTLETASCLTNPAIVIDAAGSYAHIG